jgi:hypothetical protein
MLKGSQYNVVEDGELLTFDGAIFVPVKRIVIPPLLFLT